MACGRTAAAAAGHRTWQAQRAWHRRSRSRTEQKGQGWVAHPLKKLERSAELVLGVVKREGDRFWLSPVDKRERRELSISDVKDAELATSCCAR